MSEFDVVITLVVLGMFLCGFLVLAARVMQVQASQKALEEDPETWMEEQEIEHQHRQR